MVQAPAVVIIDGGAVQDGTLVEEISTRCGARVVAFGVVERDDEVLRCAEGGVAGFVTREAGLEELVAAILSVAQGEVSCPPRITAVLLRQVTASVARDTVRTRDVYLTLRERQVVALVDQGLCNKEIATRLGVEVSTVKNHVHHLLEKLGVKRRGEAAARARRELLGLPLGRSGFFVGPLALLVAVTCLTAACNESTPPPPPLPCTSTVSGRCWVYLGPDNVHVRAVAEVDSELWIGTTSRGILRYDAWERGWRDVAFQGKGIGSIVFVPSTGAVWATVYAPTYPDTTFSYLYVSTDRGGTWRSRDGGLAAQYPGADARVTIDLSNPERLLLDTGWRVGLSEDGGATWEKVLGKPNTFLTYYAASISPANGRRAWVGGGNGWGDQFALRSDDGGHTWEETSSPGPLGYGSVSAFLPHPRNPDVVLAAISGSLQGTRDGGTSWQTVLELAHRGRRVYAFAVTDTMLVAVSDEWLSDWVPGVLGVYTASTLEGPWTVVPTPPTAAAGFSVMVDHAGKMVVGTIEGVWLVHD